MIAGRFGWTKLMPGIRYTMMFDIGRKVFVMGQGLS
jgi:hypothetical protein